MTADAMPCASSFAIVEAIGHTLRDVDVRTPWGQPTLKVRGTTFVGFTSHNLVPCLKRHSAHPTSHATVGERQVCE